MSQVLYNSLLERWRDFLTSKQYIAFGLEPEIVIQNLYDDLVDEFCKEHGYSERTEELAFFGRWWDTFKDEFYKKLDKEGVKIIHEYPMAGDWDYS